MLCEAAAIWKRLKHPNILPLLGVTIHPPQLVSDWMTCEDLPRYFNKHTGVELLGLVRVTLVLTVRRSYWLPALRCRKGPLPPPRL